MLARAAMKRIPILAELDAYSGYGLHLIEIVKGLERHGIFVSIRPRKTDTSVPVPPEILARVVQCVQPEPWEMILSHPYQLPTPGKKTIYYTMWEGDSLPHDCVQRLNTANVVIVPCEWNANTFRESGVKVPIFVVPLGIDPNVFYPLPYPKGTLVFGTAGRAATGYIRKGVSEVVYCFQEAFRSVKNVRLHIKVFPGDHVHIPEEDSRIDVCTEFLNPEKLRAWIGKLSCFVSAAKAEAWGLWQQQAMAIGRPVIAALYGGLTEFMDSENSLSVDYKIEPAQEEYLKGSKWAQPYLFEIMNRMRQVYANEWSIDGLIERARHSAMEFTWENSMRSLANVLNMVAFGESRGTINIELKSRSVRIWEVVKATSVFDQCRENGWEHGAFDFPVFDDRFRFNCGLCETNDGLVIAVRSAQFDQGNRINSRVELWKLDKMLPYGEPIIPTLEAGYDIEDPRLIQLPNNQMLMSYTQCRYPNPTSQGIAIIDKSYIGVQKHINYGFNGSSIENSTKSEKNWIWFRDRFGYMRFIYRIIPHTVICPNTHGEVHESCVVHQDIVPMPWKWGEPRGGTPPIQINDKEYLCFFHSSVPWKQRRSWYHMGAYTFEVDPPFRIKRISLSPLLSGFPNDEKMIIPHACVFPCGAIKEGDTKYLVTLGVNDEQSMFVRIPVTDVENQLVPV